MLLGTKKSLFDHIIEALLEKPSTVLSLQERFETLHINVTIQGIYKTLRELIHEDIVVKHKQVYAVNNVWRGVVAGRFAPKTRFTLSPGESASFRYTKIDHLDAFWKHTLTDIETEIGSFPVFHFTPHQFWPLVPGRKESEREYYKNLETEQIHVFTTIGGETLSDKAARDALKNEFHQIHLDKSSPFNRRDHISVMDSYIVTTRISIPLAREIDLIYQKNLTESETEKLIAPLFKKFGSVQMTVEHNEIKAKKMRKQMAQDFHISTEMRNIFDLF